MIPIITGIIGLVSAGLIILLVRKDRLHVSHGTGWIAVAIAFIFLGFAPGIVDQVAQYLGISYPPILALTLGIVVLVIKVLMMDIERSRLEVRYQRLIQRVALLETKLNEVSQSQS